MRLGDVLEWVAAACLIGAAYLWQGIPLALLAASVALAYLAQVEAETPLRKPRLRRLRRFGIPVKHQDAGAPAYHCTVCGYEGPAHVEHTCPAV